MQEKQRYGQGKAYMTAIRQRTENTYEFKYTGMVIRETIKESQESWWLKAWTTTKGVKQKELK